MGKRKKSGKNGIDCLLDVIRLENEDKILLNNNKMLFTIKYKHCGYLIRATQKLDLIYDYGYYQYYIINEINEVVCVGNGNHKKRINKKLLRKLFNRHLETKLSSLMFMKGSGEYDKN